MSRPDALASNTVLRTNSESKPRCPEQTEAYNFTKLNIWAIAVKAAPTPLPSNTVLRTNSESKPRCPEQTEAYNFTNYNIADGAIPNSKPRCPEQPEAYNFTLII